MDFRRPDLDSRERIERFVRDFYRDVAQDDLLGPIFAVARVDWPAHIQTLTDFWAWQLLGERGYEGIPLRAHEAVHARSPLRTRHFERWLAIFDETLDAEYRGPLTELAKRRARRVARALQRLLVGLSDLGGVPIEPIFQPTANVRSNDATAR